MQRFLAVLVAFVELSLQFWIKDKNAKSTFVLCLFIYLSSSHSVDILGELKRGR